MMKNNLLIIQRQKTLLKLPIQYEKKHVLSILIASTRCHGLENKA